MACCSADHCRGPVCPAVHLPRDAADASEWPAADQAAGQQRVEFAADCAARRAPAPHFRHRRRFRSHAPGLRITEVAAHPRAHQVWYPTTVATLRCAVVMLRPCVTHAVVAAHTARECHGPALLAAGELLADALQLWLSARARPRRSLSCPPPTCLCPAGGART